MRISIIILFFALFACQTEDQQEQPVQSSTYYIHQANYNPVSGEVLVSELGPGIIEIAISVKNTKAGLTHPTHLHFGSVREVGELAFKLTPIDGSTGKSITVLDNELLSDGTLLTYEIFKGLNGSIKVHMDDNYFKNMVLAFGNIGSNLDYFYDGAAVCTGH